jgi:hypothetical protein
VAEEFKVATSGVARVRNENFGPLRRASAEHKADVSDDKYLACVARIRRIEQFLYSFDENWHKNFPLPLDKSKVEGF